MPIRSAMGIFLLSLAACADVPGSTGPIRFQSQDTTMDQGANRTDGTPMPMDARSDIDSKDRGSSQGPDAQATAMDFGRLPDRQSMMSRCAESDMDGDGFGTDESCVLIDCDDSNPSIHPDSFEACNGLDDDCNGRIDESLGERVCGDGQCAVSIANCLDGRMPACVPAPPRDEICNGQDDDCDGQTDEDLVLATCGVGACQRSAECSQGQLRECVPARPAAETCNAIDDDCDGVVDNGFRARILQANYSTLDDFHPNCDGSTDRHGSACNAAINRFCAAQACGTTGFGPAENSGDLAYATCISGPAPRFVEFNTLWLEHEGCRGTANAMEGACFAAIHRYCSGAGHVTGFGPVELGPNGMQLVCLDDGVQVRQTLYSVLSQHHGPCNGTRESYGPNCNAAIKRWCISEGFASGFGPLEHNGDFIAVACLRP